MPQPYSMASTRACMWNIPPPFWKFPWCTFNIICETKGSWSTRACHSRLILSNNCNKFDGLDVLKSIKQLILFFQTSKGACSVSDANTYYELCLQRLNELKEKPNYCNSENFNCLKQTADDKTLTMSPSAQVRFQEFDFKHFIDHVFTKFIAAFVKKWLMHFCN